MNKLKAMLNNIGKKIKAAGPATGRDIQHVTINAGKLLVTLAGYLVAAVGLGLIVFRIIATGGITALLAQLMATSCVNSAAIPCDFNTLLAGIGLAIVILTGLAIAIMRQAIELERVEFTDTIESTEPSRSYNAEMAKLLRDIRGLRVIDGIKGLADLRGMAVTTARRHCEQFEKDGYIVIYSNGKGSATRIEAIK